MRKNDMEYYNSSKKYSKKNEYLPQEQEPFSKYIPITENNFADLAEASIDLLSKYKEKPLTTSKIRNILSLNAELYNDLINEPNENLSSNFIGRINYIKVRIIYEAGREARVKNFVNETHLLEVIKDIKGSRTKYILFSRYLEALVAFKKYKFKDPKNDV